MLDMNMSETARLIIGLRAAGWDENLSMILFCTSRPEKISTSQKKRLTKQPANTIERGGRKAAPHKKNTT